MPKLNRGCPRKIGKQVEKSGRAEHVHAGGARPNESERYSTIARSPSSQPNRCSRGSASSMTRRPSNSASTQTMTSPFAQAARKFGGKMKWSATGVAPGSSSRDEGAKRREAARRQAGSIAARRPARDKRARPLANARRSSPTRAIPGRCRCFRCRSHCECAIRRDKSSAPRALGPQAAVARRSRPIHSPPSHNSRAAFIASQPPAPDKSLSVIAIGMGCTSQLACGRQTKQSTRSRENGLALIRAVWLHRQQPFVGVSAFKAKK